MRNLRVRVWTAWFFCAVVIILALFSAANQVAAAGSAAGIGTLSSDVFWELIVILFAIPAALIISRQPRNTIGWLLMIFPLVSVPADLFTRYLSGFRSAPPATLPIMLMMVISSISWLAVIMPLLLIPLYFPTGRLLSPRWRWTVYLAIGMCLFLFLWAFFSKEYLPDFATWKLINPLGFIPQSADQYMLPPWTALLAALTATSVVSIIIRYRRAALLERVQMRWLLYACAVFGLVYIPGLFLETDFQGSLSIVFGVIFPLTIVAIPAAITIAILRYHLFDIDVIIRLTLVYAIVTVLLALVYVGGIALLQDAFRRATGQGSDLAVLLTTLAIATLFNPLRLRVQEMINRRFYRQKYSAEQALAEFAVAARGGSDLDALTGRLEDLISRTLQPTEVRLYLRTRKGDRPLTD